MKTESVSVLEISLHGTRVGHLVGYQGGRNVMTFDTAFREDPQRPTLTLTTHPDFPHADRLMASPWIRRQRLHPFFSNMLPEGALRDWLARSLKIHADNEFPLIAQLGHDLPGAVVATPLPADEVPAHVLEHRTSVTPVSRSISRGQGFSLAGVQMKFSMYEREGAFQLGQHDTLGDWIIKTPSTRHRSVPANEYTAMRLAEAAGIEVPEIRLVPLSALKTLPDLPLPDEQWAYAIRRYDRQSAHRIHAEDMAQVLAQYPHEKYTGANYETLGKLFARFTQDGLRSAQELARRLLINLLLANGDAHLKNWSFLYPDDDLPVLAPAYDIVFTQAYIDNEQEIALNLNGRKQWYALQWDDFRAWSQHIGVPWHGIRVALDDTLQRVRETWPALLQDAPMHPEHKRKLIAHWQRLPNSWGLTALQNCPSPP